MMRQFVRGAAVLLLLALAGVSLVQEEIRFVVAGAAIGVLIELGLALRARRGEAASDGDRARVAAVQVTCTEQDGALSVTLAGENPGRGSAPYVRLSRMLRPTSQDAALNHDRPYLELSDSRWSVFDGIEEAYLSPRLLRLTLHARGAEVLGTSEVCVTLAADSEQRRLERTLGRILRGVSFTSERSLPEDTPETPPSMAA